MSRGALVKDARLMEQFVAPIKASVAATLLA